MIAGPVQIGSDTGAAALEGKHGLDRLLSMHDNEAARKSRTFDPTRPAKLR